MVTKTTTTSDDAAPLKRLGGGRWETRDGRFTIEPQSGTWVVVDTDQMDELGLPLVRGPFASLTAAKVAITAARTSLPAESPLEVRGAAIRARDRPVASKPGKPRRGVTPTAPAPPPEPAWIAGLPPVERRHARKLIDQLTAAGAADPEGMAKRDVVGGVPAVASFAVSRAIEALGLSATPSIVARVLADGSDDDLGVRWRLVDGDGRVITLDLGPEAPGR